MEDSEKNSNKAQENVQDKKWSVYIHTNKVNNKKYVGQTCQEPTKRWKNGYGYRRNPYFWNAIQKYGWDNFEHEIVASNLTLDEANALEEFYIEKFDTLNSEKGYNMQSGGNNRLHIQETKEKIRHWHLGKTVSEETKKKLHDINSGEHHWNYGKHRSEETKRKIGEAQKGEKNHYYGAHHTDEQKEKVRQKLLGSKSYKAKSVVQLTKDLEFVKKWDCISEAKRETGISGIGPVCRGEQKTAGGYKWMYLEDYERIISKNESNNSCE